MKHYHSFLALFFPVLLLGASCTQQTDTSNDATTNVNTVQNTTKDWNANTNADIVANVNVDPVNENTNSAGSTIDDINANLAPETVADESTVTQEETTINTETIDTSEWLTYTNEILSLSFKYPPDWKLERTQDEDDFTELLDNNDIYEHELVNIYVHWSDRHDDIVYESGVTSPALDRWLSCDYVHELQSQCNTILMNGIEVIRREGQIEPPFGDQYVALAYKESDFTVVIDARTLLRESLSDGTGNTNLDGLQYINAVIETMNIN